MKVAEDNLRLIYETGPGAPERILMKWLYISMWGNTIRSAAIRKILIVHNLPAQIFDTWYQISSNCSYICLFTNALDYITKGVIVVEKVQNG